MGRFLVSGHRRGMQVTWIAERAADADDAVRQFHEANVKCNDDAVASPIDPIPGTQPEPHKSPPEAAAVVSSRAEQAAPAGSIPSPPPAPTPAPTPTGRKRGPDTEPSAAASPEPEPAEVEVGVLEAYGVKPNDLAELYSSGLRTVAAVEKFDRERGGLTAVHGIGPVGQQQIRDGIAAWRQTSQI
jgi:hypothetical protein